MLKLASLAMAAFASLCVAQSPLTTLNVGGNSGNVGGGLYFNLQVNTKVEITQINFRVQVAILPNTTAPTGTLDVYLGPSTYFGNITNPALWTLVSSTGVIPLVPAALNNGPLLTPICLEPGTYGIALKSNNFSHSYTNGGNPAGSCTTTFPVGTCANTTFSTTELTVRAGGAQNVFLSGGINQPRVFNGEIVYSANPACATTSVAAWERVGEGCYDRSRSFYEFWANPVAMDLGTVPTLPSGITSIMMTNVGVNYLVSPGTATIVAPTTPALAGMTGSSNLPITLDPLSPVVNVIIGGIPTPVTNVTMSSEGIVTFNGVIATTVAKAPAPFLTTGPAAIGYWKDMDIVWVPSGTTHYEYSPALGAHLFTWMNWGDYFPTTLTTVNNFQVLIYDNGNMEIRYGTMSQQGGGTDPVVTGFSAGAPSRDNGGSDLSARLGGPTGIGFLTDPIDNTPVDLSMSTRPLLGSAPIFSTNNMEPISFGGFLLIGFVGTTGSSLLGFGVPECLGYVDLAFSPVSTLFLGNPGTYAFGIPNNAGLAGVQLVGQSIVLGSTFNAAFGIGVSTSNRVNIRCGTL